MKTSISRRMVIVPFILLSRSFHHDSALAEGCPAPSFAAARTFDAGSSPVWVAVGDFNGDGKFDLAVANFHSANVSVLLGKGDGTFQPAANYNVGANPICVAVGDFNGDGRSDLSVVNLASTNVSVLMPND